MIRVAQGEPEPKKEGRWELVEIPIRTQINRDVEQWWIWRHGMKNLGVHDTVEAAMRAAGLMEGAEK